MKCSNCGSNLNMEDSLCSHCGSNNPYFEKHREDMSRFQNDFEETREQVMKKSGRFAGFSVKVTLIAVLAAVDILMILFAGNAWSVMNTIAKRKAEQNADWHRSRLEAYEQDRNYMELVSYYDQHNLYGSDSLRDFDAVYQACSNFTYIYQYIVELGTEKSYGTDEERVEYISDALEYIYDSMESDEYDPPQNFEGTHGELLEQMEYDLKILLMTYAKISPKEAEEFPKMSKGRRQVAMERGLGLYED